MIYLSIRSLTSREHTSSVSTCVCVAGAVTRPLCVGYSERFPLSHCSVYDKNMHLCPFDSGLLERNVELRFSGVVKPIYEENPDPSGDPCDVTLSIFFALIMCGNIIINKRSSFFRWYSHEAAGSNQLVVGYRI